MSTCHPSGQYYPGIAHMLAHSWFGLVQGFNPDEEWAKLPLVSIDTETTGLEPPFHRVVEVGLFLGKDGVTTNGYDWLINPGMPIPAESTKIHKITDAKVADEWPIERVRHEIESVILGGITLGYNAEFDQKFMVYELGPLSEGGKHLEVYDWVDPLVWARELYPKQRSRKLGEMALTMNLMVGPSHTAEADAKMALQVMYAMASNPRVPKEYGRLIQQQRILKLQQKDKQRRWR